MCLISKNIFYRVFGRKTDPPFDEIDLVGTHYEEWKDKILDNIKVLRSLKWQLLKMKGCNGDKLVAYYFDNNSDKTAVICHGYRSHFLSNAACPGIYFKNQGYNLVLIVSRGHDKSAGDFITFGDLEHQDLKLWLDKIENELKPKEIVLYGVSLGSNTVMRTSEFINSKIVKAMVLDCGFINTRTIIHSQVEGRAKNLFQRLVYPVVAKPIVNGMRQWGKKLGNFDIFEGDTRKSISRSVIPAFFIHGAKDPVVPLSDTKANYEACKTEKELYIVDNAEHGAAFAAGGQDLEKHITDFVARFV